MRLSTRFLYVNATAIMLTAACACQGGAHGSATASSADGIVRPLADNTTILEFDGGKVTAKDVNDLVTPQLKQFSEQSVEAYQQGARRVLVQKLVEAEAKKANVSPQELVAKSMGAQEITDKQVADFIKSRPDLQKGFKNPKTGKMEKVSKDDVKHFLQSQNMQNAQQSFIEGLMAKANAKMLLELPRVSIDKNPNAPTLGGSGAKVVIQEFSDFQCPYCARAHEVVKQIHDAYGDKVQITYRNFPLEFHPHARPAALAGICANEQGKFWQFHDKAFENQSELGEDTFKKWAKELGMDEAKFEACEKNPDTEKALERDLASAEKVGVNSTPTFFVNGKRVAGALPFEEFRSMIDAELKKN
jgi:protein-disulfide isomerase